MIVLLVGLLISGLVTTLAGVYVWSKNVGHRERAWEVLRLLLRVPVDGSPISVADGTGGDPAEPQAPLR